MKVTEFGVTVEKKVDTGYKPYMEYLEELRGKRVEFGTRDNSNSTVAMWAKAQLGEGEDLETEAAALAAQLESIIDEHFAAAGIDTGDDHAYVTTKTKVEYDELGI